MCNFIYISKFPHLQFCDSILLFLLALQSDPFQTHYSISENHHDTQLLPTTSETHSARGSKSLSVFHGNRVIYMPFMPGFVIAFRKALQAIL